MAIASVPQLCQVSAVVARDSLVQQVAQLEGFAVRGKVNGREFFRRKRRVERGFQAAGRTNKLQLRCFTQAANAVVGALIGFKMCCWRTCLKPPTCSEVRNEPTFS